MSRNKFLSIMKQLYSMKQEIQQLQNIYSPDAINYHHLQNIDKLNQQVQIAQNKLQQFQQQLIASQKNQGQHLKKLKQQNQELLTINEELVKSNDRFKDMFSKAKHEKQEMAQYLREEQELRKNIQSKHNKQIEHLKLLHAQQLYILKKKDKKN